MTSLNNLAKRVDRLEDETGGGDGYDITLREHIVRQDGTSEVFEETRIWQDERGEWNSETTEYDVEIEWPP